jgi:hypothetical protein
MLDFQEVQYSIKIKIMKTIQRVFIGIFLCFACASSAQVNIIFDTDIGGDVDDLGALAMLHHFVDKKECNLLGVMCWSTEQYSVSSIDAVNRYYNHPDIPIGVRKDKVHHQEWFYSKPICDKFDYNLTPKTAEDATVLYRKILAKAKNKSVVIVTVGPLKNIENLLNSKGDSISRWSGKKLIKKKVKEFVIMGGQFPSGKNEWNFNGDMKGVTKRVIKQLKVPITFSGFELGDAIKTGVVFNKMDKNTPLYIGWMHFSNNAPWMEKFRTGKIIDNSTFDQTAVLYAVRGGVGKYWDRVKGGKCVPDDVGGNTWIKKRRSKHSYLKLKMDSEELAKELEAMMLGTF